MKKKKSIKELAKKPFHEIILEKMREDAGNVQNAHLSLTRLIEMGDMFRLAKLPNKEDVLGIIETIRDIAGSISQTGDVKPAHDYLTALADEIEADILESSNETELGSE